MSVLLETSLGDLVFDLHTDLCPKASLNFVKLCKLKYYNNCIFHSVEKDFIAQSGDPTGTGQGGSSVYTQVKGKKEGKYFEDEIHDNVKNKNVGCIGMVNAGPNTNASQFYITLRSNLDFLDGKYTIFGELAEGEDVLERMNEAYVDKANRPYRNIRIKHTHVLEDPFDDLVKIEDEPQSPPPERDDRPEADDVIVEEDDQTIEEAERATHAAQAKSRAVVLEMIGDIPDADMKPPDNALFVCKLNPITQDGDLEIIFSRFGPCTANIIRDKKTGDSLNYAFIEFETTEAAEMAYEKMNNVVIDDRRIKCDFSQSAHQQWKQYKLGNREKLIDKRKAVAAEVKATGGGAVASSQVVGGNDYQREVVDKWTPRGGGGGGGGHFESRAEAKLGGYRDRKEGAGGDRGGYGRGGDRGGYGGMRDEGRGRGSYGGKGGDRGDRGGGYERERRRSRSRSRERRDERRDGGERRRDDRERRRSRSPRRDDRERDRERGRSRSRSRSRERGSRN